MVRKSSKPKGPKDSFSRREREIMNALYSMGKATAAQIQEAIPNPSSNTTIRTLLTILERKGHIRHTSDGPRFVYEPCVARSEMGRQAIGTLLKTFFDNSVERAVLALLTHDDAEIPPEKLDRLARLIAKAREEGQ
jgi:predicted transcriptional regulator